MLRARDRGSCGAPLPYIAGDDKATPAEPADSIDDVRRRGTGGGPRGGPPEFIRLSLLSGELGKLRPLPPEVTRPNGEPGTLRLVLPTPPDVGICSRLRVDGAPRFGRSGFGGAPLPPVGVGGFGLLAGVGGPLRPDGGDCTFALSGLCGALRLTFLLPGIFNNDGRPRSGGAGPELLCAGPRPRTGGATRPGALVSFDGAAVA